MRRGGRPILHAGQVTIRPRKTLRESRSDRMLIARGDVVADPRVVGPKPSWRYVGSHSVDTVEQWQRYVDRRAKTAIREVVLYAAFALVYLGATLYAILADRPIRGPILFGDAGAIGLIAWLLLALRARHVLREARALRKTPAADMWMRLWWSVGEGEGPIAVASLANVRGGEEVARVPVIGVTADMPTDTPVPALIHGLASGSPMIEIDGRALWPAQHARIHTERGWEPRR